MSSDIVEFNAGETFFEPVLAFFTSWIGYHVQFAAQRHDVISGRLRGVVIPQITFEDDPIIGKLTRREEVTKVKFEIVMSDPGQPIGSQVKSGRLMEFWCQQMFGHAYESASDQLETRFGNNRKQSWPSELQFAYHIRNACFHGNKFNIQNNLISTTIPTRWRGKEIQYSDNGKKLAVEFLGPADFITLLHDIKKML